MSEWRTFLRSCARSEQRQRSRPLRGIEALEDRRLLSADGLLLEPAPAAPAGAEIGSAVPGELLVHFRDAAAEQDIQRLYQSHGLTELERLYNASDTAGTRRVSVPQAALAAVASALQKNPHVHYAEPNFLASPFLTVDDTFYGYQWNLGDSQNGGISIEPAWDISTGAGTIVAVLDTGVAYENRQDATGTYYLAPDLTMTRFVAGYDFVNNDPHANDDHSHGTHVAGTIAQSTNNARGVAGVAFDASVMPVKVLGGDGSGSYAAIASGIRWAADQGAHVINLSLGGGSGSQTLEDALAYAYGKGVTIIAAAGNDGQNAVSYPAAYDEYVIAVSATRYDESLASYSNYGGSIDLAAPGGDTSVDQNGDGYGDGILQNTFNPSTKNTSDFGYYFFQGTSMAAPHVAGVAALVISQGVVDPLEVRAILQSTAEDKGSAGVDSYYGHGIVDAAAALAAVSSDNAAPAAADDSLTIQEDASVTVEVLINDSDPDGDPLTITAVGSAANGKLVVNPDNTIHYAPAADFYGTDSFSYTVDDGRGGSDTAVVVITVDAVNDAPVAVDDLAATTEGSAATIAALENDSDVDGDVFTIASFTAPVNGTVTSNLDGTLTYSPNPGHSGSDRFTYTISDGSGADATATVDVTIGANAAASAVGVADLDGSAAIDRSRWRAAVQVTLADSSGNAVAGVVVSGRWSDGKSFSGTTDSSGQLTATSVWLHKKSASISLTVESVDHPDYDPNLNSDPDGDSDGTSIIVYKDGTTAVAGFQLLGEHSDGTSSPSFYPLQAIANIQPIDVDAAGRKSLTLDYELISSQFGHQAQLTAHYGDDMDLRAGDGWQLGPPQVEAGRVVHVLSRNGVQVRLGNGRPYTNPLDAADVDYDGQTKPNDALRILNLLNRGKGGDLDSIAAGHLVQYFDTTGDGSVGPVDALQVINALSRRQSTVDALAAGEVPDCAPRLSNAAETTHDEAVLALLSEQEPGATVDEAQGAPWQHWLPYHAAEPLATGSRPVATEASGGVPKALGEGGIASQLLASTL